MNCMIKCLKCGNINEHTIPIACKDITEYVCPCGAIGQAQILRGAKGMFGGTK